MRVERAVRCLRRHGRLGLWVHALASRTSDIDVKKAPPHALQEVGELTSSTDKIAWYAENIIAVATRTFALCYSRMLMQDKPTLPHLLRLEYGYQIPKLETLCSYLRSSETARDHVLSVCHRPHLPVD